MATKKGLLDRARDAISSVFSSEPERKSPKRVAAGQKAAQTTAAKKTVSAVKKTARKAAKAVTGASSAPKRGKSGSAR